MRKTLLIGAFAVAGLAGCASGPYYDGYGYGPGYDRYYYDNGYGGPSYYGGPSVGLGYYYFDHDGRRHWHDGDRGRDSGRHWQDRGDRGGRDWRGGETVGGGDMQSYHGEMGNEAGAGRPVGGGRGGSSGASGGGGLSSQQ